jgi:outer membrane cobalamin receptor
MTKRFGAGLPYTRIGLKNGSHATSITEVEFGRTIGERLNLFVSGELKKSDGFRPNSDYSGTNVGGNLSWLMSPSWEASIGVKRHEGELGVPGDTIFFPTPNARQEDYRLDADLKLKRLSSFNQTEIQFFGSEVWNNYTDSDFGYDEMNQNTLSGIQVEQRFRLLNRHRGTAGLYGERVVADLGGGEHETHLYSSFLQLDLNSHPWMNWFVGGRIDSHSEYGRQFSPSAGATLSLQDVCAVYLNWNKSFRAPTLNELYYPGFGNPSLSPELSTGVELGMKMRSGVVRGNISYFRRWMKDMIQFTLEEGQWAPYNVAEAQVEGAELEIEFLPGGFLSSGFNLVVSETVDGLGGEVMYQPRVKGGGYVEAGRTFKEGKLEGALIVSGELVGQRNSETGEQLEKYSLIHTKLLWRILDLTVSYRLQNLLDTRYEVRQGYPMDGRSHILGLEWELWD